MGRFCEPPVWCTWRKASSRPTSSTPGNTSVSLRPSTWPRPRPSMRSAAALNRVNTKSRPLSTGCKHGQAAGHVLHHAPEPGGGRLQPRVGLPEPGRGLGHPVLQAVPGGPCLGLGLVPRPGVAVQVAHQQQEEQHQQGGGQAGQGQGEPGEPVGPRQRVPGPGLDVHDQVVHALAVDALEGLVLGPGQQVGGALQPALPDQLEGRPLQGHHPLAGRCRAAQEQGGRALSGQGQGLVHDLGQFGLGRVVALLPGGVARHGRHAGGQGEGVVQVGHAAGQPHGLHVPVPELLQLGAQAQDLPGQEQEQGHGRGHGHGQQGHGIAGPGPALFAWGHGVLAPGALPRGGEGTKRYAMYSIMTIISTSVSPS